MVLFTQSIKKSLSQISQLISPFNFPHHFSPRVCVVFPPTQPQFGPHAFSFAPTSSWRFANTEKYLSSSFVAMAPPDCGSRSIRPTTPASRTKRRHGSVLSAFVDCQDVFRAARCLSVESSWSSSSRPQTRARVACVWYRSRRRNYTIYTSLRGGCIQPAP